MSTRQVPPTVVPLVGRKWKAVINGKKALNGERYSVTFTGDIEAADDGQNVYDVLRELASHIEEVNKEMEHPDSFQVTLYSPNQPADRAGEKGQS